MPLAVFGIHGTAIGQPHFTIFYICTYIAVSTIHFKSIKTSYVNQRSLPRCSPAKPRSRAYGLHIWLAPALSCITCTGTPTPLLPLTLFNNLTIQAGPASLHTSTQTPPVMRSSSSSVILTALLGAPAAGYTGSNRLRLASR